MSKSIPVLVFLAFLLCAFAGSTPASPPSETNRILDLVEKMEAAFKEVKDYTCDVEQVFYQDGAENQRYRFKYYFKREKRIRVDFHYPYSSLSFFYDGGDEVIAVPFRGLGVLKFHLSIDNPKLQTMAGQRINQTDMGYFIRFLSENLTKIPQKEEEFEEEGDRVNFWIRALDYINGKSVERYRIFISKENWLPLRIERYSLEMKPLEETAIKNYMVNAHLKDELFIP